MQTSLNFGFAQISLAAQKISVAQIFFGGGPAARPSPPSLPSQYTWSLFDPSCKNALS